MTAPKPKTEVNVLIVFYSRYGATEKLALAAGVGAIQARANIRLRRLADSAAPEVIAADAAWTENLARMNLDYVVPRDADPLWADVLVFAAPAGAPGEMSAYLTSLKIRAAQADSAANDGAPKEESFSGKMCVPFTSGSNDAALGSLYTSAASSGFMVIPDPGLRSTEDARVHGRRAAEMARALKSL